MKKIFVLFVALFFLVTIQDIKAQTTYSNLEIGTFKRPALFIEAEGNSDDVEAAVIDYFKVKGYKREKVKGGIIKFSSARVDKVGTTLDYYFKVDKKNKKESNIWFATGTTADAYTDSTNTDTWRMLNEFSAFLKATVFPYYATDKKLTQKQKDLKGHQEDLSDLEKQKQKLEKEIEEKKKDIANHQKEVADLTTLKDSHKKGF